MMLNWLGMTKSEKHDRDFFGNVKRRTVQLVLLSALMLLFGVEALFSYLIPTAALADPLVAVLPGTLGVLVAVVYVFVLERVFQDRQYK